MQAYADGAFSWRERHAPGERRRPLVLLHGIGGSSESFEPCAAGLAIPGRRLLAWDMPGYGASTPLAGDAPTAEAYSEALLRFVEARNVDRFDLAAHSLGAVIAGAALQAWPRRIGHVVFICPLLGMAALPEAQRMQIAKERVDAIDQLGMEDFARSRGSAIIGARASVAVRDACIDIMARVPLRGYLQAWRMLVGENVLTRLTYWRGRSMVITGGADPVAPQANADALRAALSGVTDLLDIPDCGHFPMAEATQEFNTEMNSFLANNH